MRKFIVVVFSCLSLLGQSNSGELRLKVLDQPGFAVRASVHITCDANQYRRTLAIDDQGTLTLQRLPYGLYQIEVYEPGFAPASESAFKFHLRHHAESEFASIAGSTFGGKLL